MTSFCATAHISENGLLYKDKSLVAGMVEKRPTSKRAGQ